MDGCQHLSSLDAYRRDRRKDALLQEHGYFVLRFLTEDIGKRLDDVLDQVLRALIHVPGGDRLIEFREKDNFVRLLINAEDSIKENVGALLAMEPDGRLAHDRRYPNASAPARKGVGTVRAGSAGTGSGRRAP